MPLPPGGTSQLEGVLCPVGNLVKTKGWFRRSGSHPGADQLPGVATRQVGGPCSEERGSMFLMVQTLYFGVSTGSVEETLARSKASSSHPGTSGSSLLSGPDTEHWLPLLPRRVADLHAIPSLPPTCCPQAGVSFLKPTQGLSLLPGPSGSCLLLAWHQKGTPPKFAE